VGAATAMATDSALPLRNRWETLADPVFFNMRRDDGQPFDTVTAIAQDGEGFLWLGTENGLNRWDGYKLKHYAISADPSSSQDAYVQTLHTDARGALWIGTANQGLAYYDRATDGFTFILDGPAGLSDRSVFSIDDDGAGGLWIGTGVGEDAGGLDHFDLKTRTIAHYLHDSEVTGSVPANSLRAVLHDRAGDLWVGTLKGLARKRADSSLFEPIDVPAPAGVVPRIHYLFESSDAKIWVGTYNIGVFVVDPAAGTASALHETDPRSDAPIPRVIEGFAQPSDDELWIATRGQGIVAVNLKTLQTRRLRHDAHIASSLPHDGLWTLYRDSAGLIWVGSARGLSRHNPRQLGVLTIFGGSDRPGMPTGSAVTSLTQDRNGRLWLGYITTDNVDNLVEIVDPALGRIGAISRRALSANIAITLAAQGDEMYVGTDRGRIYRIDSGNVPHEPIPLGKRAPSAVTVQLLTRDDLLWVAGRDGLWNVSPVAGSAPVLALAPTRLTNSSIGIMAFDHQGVMWLGTEYGLNRFNPNTGEVRKILPDTSRPDGFSAGSVSSLLEDARGRVWIGTADGGINVLQNRGATDRFSFRHITTGDGLPNANIAALLEAPDGTIWVSTHDGIGRIDPDTFAVSPLQRADGVALTYYYGGAAVTAQGEMVFGGEGGLTVIRPEKLVPWRFNPRVVLTALSVGERAVPLSRFGGVDRATITVTPDANSLVAEFAALDLSAPEENRYAYRLEGYDPDWTTTDATRRVATYNNLPPGDYRLRVRGTNHAHEWSSNEIDLPVHVVPPWFLTWWAAVSFVALAIGILWSVVRWRVHRLHALTLSLERTVSERTRSLAEANRQLESAMHTAEEATQAKSTFLANMSHEIRTPMNAVLGFAQLGIRQNALTKTHEYFGKISAAGHHLLGILNDILDFSKIEAGKLDLEAVAFRTRDVLGQVHEMLLLRAAERGLTFSVNSADDVPENVVGDPLRLSQVLVNLANNAIKFTRSGSISINVRADQRKGEIVRLCFDVVDSGIGMTRDQQERLFQPFVQADTSTTRHYGGTGLGLAISQRLVVQMGGTLCVESEVGAGSRFYFDIEVRVAADAAVAQVEALSPPKGILVGAAVLLVEDNPMNQELAIGLLQMEGVRVDVANNGNEAVRMANAGSYDCILMDVEMPVMDGCEATRRIRAFDSQIPIIAITAHAAQQRREDCLNAGMNDFIARPIDANELFTMIARWIRVPK
jgi:signal transduction histidine kinase/ligand-binding sensor domain-containing protein/CheY-like chemotaxis protein